MIYCFLSVQLSPIQNIDKKTVHCLLIAATSMACGSNVTETLPAGFSHFNRFSLNIPLFLLKKKKSTEVILCICFGASG